MNSACVKNGVGFEAQDNIIYEEGCPFTYVDESDRPKANPCDVCDGQFTATGRNLSPECASAIYDHCKYFYREDDAACSDFPEVIIGGSCDYDKLPQSAFTALELGISTGRDGKGTIFTFASGNSFYEGDNVNFSGWTNSRYTISVGAVGKHEKHADYSTPGAALMVSAPSGDSKDIGHLMTAGLGVDTCQDSGQGTSFACPVVSGVIALMLEANPELGWRDVQGILAVSSKVVNDEDDETVTVNGAGVWHSSWYGFGIVNAKNAVEAALNWDIYSPELQAVGISPIENAELSDDEGNEFVSVIDMNPQDDNYPEDFVAESTVVLLDLSHYNRGDLEIELVSPSGTTSLLHPGKRPENTELAETERWKLMTLKNWGEDVTGQWQLKIRDLVDREENADTDFDVFRQWQLIVYGRSDGRGGGSGQAPEPEPEPSGALTSEFCENPNAENPGCKTDSFGNSVCPAESQINMVKERIKRTVDASIVCPNDILESENIGYKEASQRDLCSCEASLFDDNCRVLERNLECQCFICPEGSKVAVSYSCNKEIVPGCNSFDCDQNCNGAYDPPLMHLNVKPTNSPTVRKIEEDEEVEEEVEGKVEFGADDHVTCETALTIEAGSGAIVGTIRSLQLVALEGSCLSGLETVGGWYRVNGNGNIFTMTACSLDVSRSVGVSVFDGECSKSKCIDQSSRQIAACGEGSGHAVSFVSEPGKAYYVLVSGIPVGAPLGSPDSSSSSSKNRLLQANNNNFQLEFTEAEVAPNNKCSNSLPASFERSVSGSTTGLLTEFKTCHDTLKTGAWYSIEGSEPNEDGVIVYEANTCNAESDFYNTISVYRGDECGENECVDVDVLPCPSGWFGQQVFWSTSLKESFQIFIHSSDTVEAEVYDAGNFQMDLHFNERLENDQCAAALEVEVNREGSVKSTTSGAKPDIYAIENSSCGTGGAGAWYTVKGTGATFQASTCSSETNHKTSIQVYSGECGRLNCIDSGAGNKALCDDGRGAAVNFQTQENVDYYILVTGRREGQTGNFGLQVMESDPPGNNQCDQAITLGPQQPDVDGSTLQATVSFASGDSCVVPLNNPGIWYEMEGTGKGVEIIVEQKNDFDSAISIFKSPDSNKICQNLECIAGSSAVNPTLTDFSGVTTSFFGESGAKYHIYVHGSSSSSNNMGDFTIAYNEFDVTDSNEFCRAANEVPTDGSRIQGSTEDASVTSVPTYTCGADINSPGLWYTFQGNGQPMEITACSEDGDFDVSVSVFEGGPNGCDSLTCLTGTTFVDNACSGAPKQRFLQDGSSSDFRFMTKGSQLYYIFVHGDSGVGDFDLYVRDEMVSGYGTDSPTVTPVRHARDLYRWIPEDTKVVDIATDYINNEIIYPPQGNYTVNGYIIKYSPPPGFVGVDTMSVEGCARNLCWRYDITVDVQGERVDLNTSSGWNKLWLLLLILLLLIPIVFLPFYLFYKNKGKDDTYDDKYDYDDDDEEYELDERGHLTGGARGSRRGVSGKSSSIGEDWSSDDDDLEGFDGNESRDSGDEESEYSDSQNSSESESEDEDPSDGLGYSEGTFSSDGFKDER